MVNPSGQGREPDHQQPGTSSSDKPPAPDSVEEADLESFPASDPPAWTADPEPEPVPPEEDADDQ